MSHRGGDCSDDHVCATPLRSARRWQKPAAADTLAVAPGPSRWSPPRPSAAYPTNRSAHEAASAPVGPFGSPSSHVTPNASMTAGPSDISIGDAGDISIGDLQVSVALGTLMSNRSGF